MSLNQDLAREIEEYWDRAEARLESLAAVMRTHVQLLELAGDTGLDEQQKEDLAISVNQMIDAGIAGIVAAVDQYAEYLLVAVEDRSPLPDERVP